MSQKRSLASTSATHPSAKRQKRAVDDTSRLTTAALLAEAPSASYLAIRQETPSTFFRHNLPSLASCALRVVVESFASLFLAENGQIRSSDEAVANAVAWLRLLPPSLCNRLLRALLETSQNSGDYGALRISVSALSSLFLHSGHITSFALPSTYFRAAQPQYDPGNDLINDPENILATISGRPHSFVEAEQAALRRASKDRSNLLDALRHCTSLRSLNLAGQSKLLDETLAKLLGELSQLEEVVLKGCTAVGDASIRALAKAAGRRGVLKKINLNYTAVTVGGLKSLFARCKTLQVLKLANVNGLVSRVGPGLCDIRCLSAPL